MRHARGSTHGSKHYDREERWVVPRGSRASEDPGFAESRAVAEVEVRVCPSRLRTLLGVAVAFAPAAPQEAPKEVRNERAPDVTP